MAGSRLKPPEVAADLVPSVKYTGVGGSGCLDIGPIISDYSEVHIAICRRDFSVYPIHWKGTGGLPSQGFMLDFRVPTAATG